MRPGQFEFFVAYAGKDEFNLDAQAESFLYRAEQKGIPVTVRYLPDGHHNAATARKFMPDVIRVAGREAGQVRDREARRLGPFAPNRAPQPHGPRPVTRPGH